MLEWIAPPKTPAHYRAKWIDKEIPEEETEALTIGTLTHRLILEPETGLEGVAIKPEGLSLASKEGRAFKAENDGRMIISTEQSIALLRMRDSVWNHPAARQILKNSDHERSVFADDKGLLLKSRFDILPHAGNTIADFKTIESADLDSVERAVWEYGYYRQAAFYLRVANLCGLNRENFVLIFAEKTPPYAVAVYALTSDVIEAGKTMINRDLMLLRQCLETNEWPGYSPNVQACGVPMWAMKQIENLV